MLKWLSSIRSGPVTVNSKCPSCSNGIVTQTTPWDAHGDKSAAMARGKCNACQIEYDVKEDTADTAGSSSLEVSTRLSDTPSSDLNSQYTLTEIIGKTENLERVIRNVVTRLERVENRLNTVIQSASRASSSSSTRLNLIPEQQAYIRSGVQREPATGLIAYRSQ